ncbi:MAG: DUF3575 domain-containing protein [candidate division Zixibacteria bacterium]|nr:DUF3575 domain-containing protein [candidate division Zixibacteria bacterium]
MRKTLLVTAVAALAAPALGADFNNEVDVGILSLFWGNFNARYERNLNDYISLAGGGGFSPNGYLFVSDEDVDWKVYNVNGIFRFYPLGNFRGLYAQAEVSGDFHNLKDKSTGDTAKVTMVTPAVVVGWRWVIAQRATITLGAGSGYASADLEVGDEVIKFEGVRPRFDFNLGFMF